jgi:hypothetical protein
MQQRGADLALSEERIAKNDSIFREANEGIAADVYELGLGELRDAAPFICECADPACRAIVRVPLATYESVRSKAELFINAPGHQLPFSHALRVAEEHDGFLIVEKTGRAADLARDLDPRQRSARRAERLSKNEHLFRVVNQQIDNVDQSFARGDEMFVAICECAQLDCIEQFEIQRSEYEKLRSDPTLFAIKPGHEAVDVEDVVATRPQYVVVRKRPGPPARVARDAAVRDPRT